MAERAISNKNYFLTVNGKQYGPYTVTEVQQLVTSQSVNMSALAWSEGMPSWIPLGNIPDFAAAAPKPEPKLKLVHSQPSVEDEGQKSRPSKIAPLGSPARAVAKEQETVSAKVEDEVQKPKSERSYHALALAFVAAAAFFVVGALTLLSK